MKVRICKSIDIDDKIDVDLDDVLDEFGSRVDETKDGQYWRGLLPAVDVMTRMLARIDDGTIAAFPPEANRIIRERLLEQAERYKVAEAAAPIQGL